MRISSPLRLMVLVLITALVAPVFWLGSSAQVANGASFRIIGYVTSWQGSLNDVQYDKLTHINYAFHIPTSDGSGNLVNQPADWEQKLDNLVSMAHARGVKVLISFGGWSGDAQDERFQEMARTESGRNNFVNNVVAFVNANNLDGADIDWEYPRPEDAANYALLMKALSEKLHSQGKLLTAAVVSDGSYGDTIRPEVFEYVDFLNLMAYDGGSGADHSPYSLAERSIDYWQGRGLSRDKTVLGVPFYSRPSWAAYSSLLASGCSSRSDTCTFQGVTNYYNGIPTMQQKTALALNRGGGIMIWELAHDANNASSLLSAIYDTVKWAPPPTLTVTPVASPPTSTPVGSCTAPAWQSSKIYYQGDVVAHNGQQWQAQWWTQGEEPGTTGEWGVWRTLGPCGGATPQPTATSVAPPTATSVAPPTATTQPSATPGSGYPAWAPGTAYTVGALVTYSGQVYKCIQAHTSQTGWEPPNVPALWERQ